MSIAIIMASLACDQIVTVALTGFLMDSMSTGLVRPHSSKIGFFHRLFDALVILFSLIVALQVTRDLPFSGQYAQAGVWGVMIFLMIGGARHLYSSWRLVPVHEAVMATLEVWFWTAVALVFLAFLSKSSSDYSRMAILTWFVLAPVALAAVRVVLGMVLNALRTNGRNTRTLAIAGKTKLGKQVAEMVEQTPWLGMRVIGYDDDRLAKRECKHAAVDAEGVGRFEELVALARAGKTDYI